MNDRDSRLSEPKTSLADSRQTDLVSVYVDAVSQKPRKVCRLAGGDVYVRNVDSFGIHNVKTVDFERLAKKLKAVIILKRDSKIMPRPYRFFTFKIGAVEVRVFEVD